MTIMRCLAALFLALCGACVSAQQTQYPERQVEIIVPWPPGGGTDSVGRILAEAARDLVAQPLVVVNRPGASGSIGFAYTLAEPAQYKLAVVTPEILLLPLLGIGNISIDAFTPIARLTDDPLAITVRADAPWQSMQEFVAHARANPETVTLSIAGYGTTHHVGAVALAEATGAQFVSVPYQGTAPAVMAVLSGEVAATTAAYAELAPYVASGKLRTLVVMARARVPAIAEVPTMQEIGYDVHYSTWRALAMAKGTPAGIVAYWQDLAAKVLAQPVFTEKLALLSITPTFADARQFAADLAAQRVRYEALLSNADFSK